MRKLSSIVLVCLAVVTAGAAVAATTASHHTAKGDVTSVDASAMTLAVKGEKAGSAEHTYVVDSATKFTSDGKPATFADVKVGEDVTVRFVMKDGKMDATEIKIAAPAKPAGH
jgi:hypothetical protein